MRTTRTTRTTRTHGLAAAIAVGLVACGPGRTTISVRDNPAPLTSSRGDALFTITFEDVDEPFFADAFEVVVARNTGALVALSCITNDRDANGDLDEDDQIACSEPPANANPLALDYFDESTVGRDVKVTLNDTSGSDARHLLSVTGIWSVEN